MPPSLADQIEAQAEAARQLYHRLVLVVGEARTGKTVALRQFAERQGWPLINLNLTLSERLLELTSRQRALKTARVVGDIVANHAADIVLIDNTEMLFHPELKLDPLRLLQSLSRNRVIVASWKGTSTDRQLVYAAKGHREYRQYSITNYEFVITNCGKGMG